MSEDNSNVDFIDKEFLQQALQNHTRDPDLRVTNFDLQPATAKGDNYMSVLHRATIEYTRKRKKETKSVIIKMAPGGDGGASEMACLLF